MGRPRLRCECGGDREATVAATRQLPEIREGEEGRRDEPMMRSLVSPRATPWRMGIRPRSRG
jgi:hypothetical protein